MIMQKIRPPQITYAVDIQESAINQLRLGLDKSETKGIVPICADLKELWENAPLGQLDLVTCNPPYKAANSGFESEINSQRIARHEIMCNIDDVCKAASKLLKYGGRLCMCNRPNPNEAPWLFLIEGKKGSKPFMQVESQLYIRSESGFSEELQRIYNIGKEEK